MWTYKALLFLSLSVSISMHCSRCWLIHCNIFCSCIAFENFFRINQRVLLIKELVFLLLIAFPPEFSLLRFLTLRKKRTWKIINQLPSSDCGAFSKDTLTSFSEDKNALKLCLCCFCCSLFFIVVPLWFSPFFLLLLVGWGFSHCCCGFLFLLGFFGPSPSLSWIVLRHG